jgi:hypothetical protein
MPLATAAMQEGERGLAWRVARTRSAKKVVRRKGKVAVRARLTFKPKAGERSARPAPSPKKKARKRRGGDVEGRLDIEDCQVVGF